MTLLFELCNNNFGACTSCQAARSRLADRLRTGRIGTKESSTTSPRALISNNCNVMLSRKQQNASLTENSSINGTDIRVRNGVSADKRFWYIGNGHYWSSNVGHHDGLAIVIYGEEISWTETAIHCEQHNARVVNTE